jgi:hypothetical protein
VTPDNYSFSQVNSWLHCPKQYQLSRLLWAPQTPSVWLAAGTALHDAIETINRAHHERNKSGTDTDV